MTTPSDQVRGPQDLVAYMNEATSEDWDKVPFPAKQQLGFHDRLGSLTINDYTGKSPEELVHAEENSVPTDSTVQLSSYVDYHLESTPPPAEPAGAPGSSGYNRLNRGVPAAKGFESDAEHEVTQTPGGRVVQYEPDQGLSPEEQAKVDGVGPFVPSPVAIQAGSSDERTDEAEQPVYGTANGVRHGDATSFDRKKAAKVSEKSEAAPAAAGVVSTQDETDGSVPSGSIDKVLAWVGHDAGRAQSALDAEQGREEPRQSLIARLNERLNG